MQPLLDFYEKNAASVNVGVVLLLAMIALFWAISFVFRGSLIKVMDRQQGTEKRVIIDGKLLWQQGKETAIELLKLDLLVWAFILVLLSVLGLPIFYLYISHRTDSAAFLFFIALMIYAPVVALAYFIRYCGLVHIVLGKLTVFQSIERSYILALKHFRDAVKMLFLIVVLDIFKELFLAAAIVFCIIIAFFVVLGLNAAGVPEHQAQVILISFFFVLVAASIFLTRSIFGLWTTDLWVWWTKKFGGIQIKEEKTKMTDKLLIKQPEAVGVERSDVEPPFPPASGFGG